MSPALEPSPLSSQTTDSSRKKPLKATSLLHRTPWRPPVGVSAKGIYIVLDDGRRLIDAVGGAAVACVGSSHPAVMQVIKDQVDKVCCKASYFISIQGKTADILFRYLQHAAFK